MTKDSELGAATTQGHGGRSARYKVGDKVKFIDEDCSVIGVSETRTGRWVYNIERNGVCIAVGVTENMLDPADERKRRAFAEEIASRAADAAKLRIVLRKYVRKTRTDTDRAGRFMGLKMTIDKRALDAASDDLNATLRLEFGAIDGMDAAAQQDAAARMKSRIDSNLDEAGFEGMRVQIQLHPARARLVKVEL